MFISKLMTRQVVSINPDADIQHAQKKMSEYNFRHLPVVTANNQLIGIVTDRDLRSAMPSSLLFEYVGKEEQEKFLRTKVKDIMTTDLITISPLDTLQDALVLLQRKKIGAFPVVAEQKKLVGIISVRDILRECTNVLGLDEPGTLLCVVVENKIGQMKKIVDAITEENISFGSVMVARYWEEGKRAVFPYLLTQNISPLKRKLRDLGYALLDPKDWR